MNPPTTNSKSPSETPDLLYNLRQIIRNMNRPAIRSVPELLNTIPGNRNAATMCLYLLYWFPRATRFEGWVYKSLRDWQAECNLSRGQVKRVHHNRYLEAVGIVRKTMKANGIPTTHYRLDLNRFVLCVAQCLNAPAEWIQARLLDPGNYHNLSELAETTASNGSEQPNGNGQNDPNQLADTTHSITITTRQHNQQQNYQDNKQQRADVVVDSDPDDCDAVEEIRQDLEELGIQQVTARKLMLEYCTKRIQAVMAHARQQTVHIRQVSSFARWNKPGRYLTNTRPKTWTNLGKA